MDNLVKPLTLALLTQTGEQASLSPRLRQNHNLHKLSDHVQRFVNVLQPGTYVRPHRHLRGEGKNGFELFAVLQGEIGLIILDETGHVQSHCRIGGDPWGLELAEGVYHTLVALQPNTAILEIKEGPYEPTSDKDFLPNFPFEGTIEAAELVHLWTGYFSHAG
ncbi:WbuC family cupin fold metalloprotein [Tumidithrix elongata RA019]|uniref:WbuC family cupin fold metalloprotein n=1 Tax=Tumidithrix elongata BACA0141 TaxID=2716417 RepID=A0AAW9PW85_9CYAN|nr:WbuC family cupin fold metalloprotein [Tumidithrix elongata RA019]